MIDRLKQRSSRLAWSKIDPELPGGLCRPQKEGDIGWDLVCMEDTVIPPMAVKDVPVNLRLQLPPGVYALIWNRSSMGRRNLHVDTNLIDNGYRGPLFVQLRSMQLPATAYDPAIGLMVNNNITVQAGERIAQLLFQRAVPLWDDEVIEVPADTARGVTGFGSTGT